MKSLTVLHVSQVYVGCGQHKIISTLMTVMFWTPITDWCREAAAVSVKTLVEIKAYENHLLAHLSD